MSADSPAGPEIDEDAFVSHGIGAANFVHAALRGDKEAATAAVEMEKSLHEQSAVLLKNEMGTRRTTKDTQ